VELIYDDNIGRGGDINISYIPKHVSKNMAVALGLSCAVMIIIIIVDERLRG
jgi:hypothetical protein